MNRRIVLRSHPAGALRTEHFAIEEVPVPTPLAGQVLLRTLYLSLDPYLPGALGDEATDGAPIRTGQVMAGAQMCHWLDSGTVRLREDLVDGLDNAPRAFIGLLQGRRFGKLVIRVAR